MITRRGLLAGILSAGVAPSIVHNPMKIWVPKTVDLTWSDLGPTLEMAWVPYAGQQAVFYLEDVRQTISRCTGPTSLIGGWKLCGCHWTSPNQSGVHLDRGAV